MVRPLADGTIPEVGMRVQSVPGTTDRYAVHYLKSYATIVEIDNTTIGCLCSFPEIKQKWWLVNRCLVPVEADDADGASINFNEAEFLSLIGGDGGGS